MNFSDELNNYIDIIGCSAKELSNESKISTSVISRYRSGERTPKYNSNQIESLIKGLSILARKNNISTINEEIIRKEFNKILYKDNINFELFRNNFNILITNLNINISELSKYIGFDSSYISKIRKGTRKPQNLYDFVSAIIKYITTYYNDNIKKNIISSLIECNINDLDNQENYKELLTNWLCNNTIKEDKSINDFLFKLDEFDLNNYIKIIKFDKMKVPTIPINIPKSKTYYGLKGFKNSQLDAIKTIVLSKSTDDIFLYSNMPIIEGSKDLNFTKKYMFGLALILKKGIHINIIHNLERPWKELMLGLTGWIPLYMTGQISPYYFKNNYNNLYSQLECTTNIVSLSGTSLTDNLNTSKFYLTTKTNELPYYKERAKLLLKKASPLMKIYTINNRNEFEKVLNTNINNDRRNIYSTLPIYTINYELLNKILTKNNINNEDKETIINYIKEEKNRIEKILTNNKILDEISILSPEDFNNNQPSLSLSNLFYDKKILYNYEEYKEHIKLTKDFKINNKNYNYKTNNNYIFKNINIHIIKNNQIIISKENNPSIHFVINHPKLIDAIENFKQPI